MSNLFGGGVDIPKQKPEELTKTALRVDSTSEAAKKNRRRAASFLTKRLDEPKLSQPGLLGF